jgi:hypothetical protein
MNKDLVGLDVNGRLEWVTIEGRGDVEWMLLAQDIVQKRVPENLRLRKIRVNVFGQINDC